MLDADKYISRLRLIVKGVDGGFTAGVARDVFESTGLR